VNTKYRLAGALGALALLPCLARAQAPAASSLPTAQALVARSVEAIGGRAAIERLPARWESSRIEIAGQGLSIAVQLFMSGNRIVTLSEMPGLGTIRSGFDGEVGWAINPAVGPQVLDGNQLQQARQGADPLAVLHPERYVASMQTIEETDFGGGRCYRVRVTTPWGETYDEFFNKETGLPQGSVRRQSSPQGDVEITARITEYRTVAGVRLPRVTQAEMMGMQIISTVDSTEIRAIPDSVFALPPEVRALRPPR
jgi:zinc protease